jgi:hypothetical protein
VSDFLMSVVDEADVLFVPEFIDLAALLNDDAAARKLVPAISRADPQSTPQAPPTTA